MYSRTLGYDPQRPTERVEFYKLEVVLTERAKPTGETREIGTYATYNIETETCLFQESNQGWLINEFNRSQYWEVVAVKVKRFYVDSCVRNS